MGSRVTADDARAPGRQAQLIEQPARQLLGLVGDDAPADLPRFQRAEQFRHAWKEPRLAADVAFVELQELPPHGGVIGMVWGDAESNLEQSPGAKRRYGARRGKRKRGKATRPAHVVERA